MSPSQYCKSQGLKSLAQLSAMTGQSPQTLINWHETRPSVFRLLVAGAVAELDKQKLEA